MQVEEMCRFYFSILSSRSQYFLLLFLRLASLKIANCPPLLGIKGIKPAFFVKLNYIFVSQHRSILIDLHFDIN